MLLLMVLLMRSLISEHMLYILTIPDMCLNACLVHVTYHMDGYDRNAVVGNVSQQMSRCLIIMLYFFLDVLKQVT